MPTVRLHTGTVTAELSPSLPDKGIVGSGAIWDDASDSTYYAMAATRGAGDSYPGDAPLDALSLPAGATVTDVTVNVRAADVGTPHGENNITVRLQGPTDGFNQGVGPMYNRISNGARITGIVVQTGGVATDFSVSIPEADVVLQGYTWADFMATLVGGANVFVDQGTLGALTGQKVAHRIYELSVDVTYAGVELPCDTDVALDLSTAVFLDNSGTLSGQYVDGVITSTTDFLQPDFHIPGLVVDPLGVYKITFTYDPDSPHDGGSREAYVSGLRPGHEQDDVDTAYAAGDEYSDIAVWWDTWTSETGDTLTFVVGPGRGPGPVGDHVSGVVSWDDSTYGVAAGYTAPWFESAAGAALSGITIRKLCTFAVPPLRLINRGGDQFSSAWAAVGHQRTRQGGNRNLGIL